MARTILLAELDTRKLRLLVVGCNGSFERPQTRVVGPRYDPGTSARSSGSSTT